jgi:predicted Zn-ribbon and HTH transcriptional regulator
MTDKKEKEEAGHNILICGNKCYRCGHEWTQREEEKPRICPKCKSPYWDKPKTKFNKDEKK